MNDSIGNKIMSDLFQFRNTSLIQFVKVFQLDDFKSNPIKS
jgi:hypothetical protein